MPVISASAEIEIDAHPDYVWQVLTDPEGFPRWSKIHKKVEVRTHNAEGWPERVWMRVSVVGIKDDQLVDHYWTDDSVSWELIEGGIQKAQTGTYTVTETATGSRARLDVTVDLSIPIPKLVLTQGQKLINSIATKGVKAEAERLQREALKTA